MDTKFAEQFLERVYTVLHAADDDRVYVELVHLLNDFGERQKTPDSVPQVQSCCVVYIRTSCQHLLHSARCSLLLENEIFFCFSMLHLRLLVFPTAFYPAVKSNLTEFLPVYIL